MGPAKLLDKINKMRNVEISDEVREYIVHNETFRKIAKTFEDDMPDDPFLVYKRIKEVVWLIDKYRGDCPKCGGFAHWRSGAEFDSERLCIVCRHTWCP